MASRLVIQHVFEQAQVLRISIQNYEFRVPAINTQLQESEHAFDQIARSKC